MGEKKTKLCLLRDIFRSIREFEIEFQEQYDLCLNEGMALCSLRSGKKTSSDLAELLGLSASNTSKVIKSIEVKNLIQRSMGEKDKRLMYFELTSEGIQKLQQLQSEEDRMSTILSSIYASNEL